MMRRFVQFVFTCGGGGLLMILSGCTMTPHGTASLKAAARKDGDIYRAIGPIRSAPLPHHPTASELVTYALMHSPTVEADYWQFRAAIERIPQAGTEMTTPMLSGDLALLNGTASAANSTVGIANMGSSDIRWPSKPAADAKIALDRARAAQSRLRAAQYRLRRQVLTAWYRLIYTRDLLRDIHSQITNDRMAINAVREEVVNDRTPADMPVGQGIQLTRLKLKRIELRRLAASETAQLNSLLNRPVHKTIHTPPHLPAIQRPLPSYATLLRMAVRHNPELRRQHWLRHTGESAVSRAEMQFIPNFDLGAMTSLDGAMQNLQGAVMFPIVRYRAIDASVRQAQFDVLNSEEGILSMRNDLARRLATDLIAIRSDAKQLTVIKSRLLPRLQEMKHFADVKIEQNGIGLTSELKASNSIIRIHELQLSLQLDRLIRNADIDAVTAVPVASVHQPVPRPGASSGK